MTRVRAVSLTRFLDRRRMIDKMIQKIDSINEWWQYILTENPDTRDIDVDVLSRKVNDVSAFKDMADEINRLKQ